jgi:hypothetical protein
MTAAETGTVAAAGVGALVGFVDALSPMLSPEKQAQLTLLAGQIQTTTDAAVQAVGVIAQSIADIKAASEEEAAGAWSTGEKGTAIGAVGALSLAASRAMSAFKHKDKAATTPKPQ